MCAKTKLKQGNRDVLYLRYSDKNQQELSIEGQLRMCMEFCENRGDEIVGTYTDRAKSGRSETRDEFQRMMKDAAKGLFDIVVVYKLSRFFRNRTEAALYRKELKKYGVKLLSATEQIPEGRGGIFYEAILEAEAEAYSLGLSEDTQRGMLDAAMKCQVTGPLPMGYKSVPISSDSRVQGRKMEIEPAAAAIVRRAFDMYNEGYNIADICNTFNNEGLRTHRGSRFQISVLTNMLQNVRYIGVYRYKNEIEIAGGCPAIVDKKLFEEVNRRLATRKKAPQRGRATVDFLLSSKLYCGHCSKAMFGASGTGRNNTKYYYYTCSGHAKGSLCNKTSVRKDYLENLVLKAALEQMTPANIDIIARDTEAIARKESQNFQVIDELKRDLAGVENEISNIGKAIAQGIITETTKKMLEESEAYRADIKQRLKQEQLIANTLVTQDSVVTFLGNFLNGNPSDITFRRKVFDMLVREVYVYDGNGTDGDDGHVVIWCNIGKGIEIKRNLHDESNKNVSSALQTGEPALNSVDSLEFAEFCYVAQQKAQQFGMVFQRYLNP